MSFRACNELFNTNLLPPPDKCKPTSEINKPKLVGPRILHIAAIIIFFKLFFFLELIGVLTHSSIHPALGSDRVE